LKTDWQQEGGKMRLYVDGYQTHAVVEMDGERWKASHKTGAAWFTSLKDARLAAERSTLAKLPLEVFTRM